MFRIITFHAFLLLGLGVAAQEQGKFKLVVHGGAGYITKERFGEEKWAEYKLYLDSALISGATILESGGDAIDAVTAAITILEDCPLFNAGKGAVFSNAERNELDASIMDGRDQNAGAVAGVTHIKNPILAALWVKDSSEHVMLQGEGAEVFYQSKGGTLVDTSYFLVPSKLEYLRKVKAEEERGKNAPKDSKHGTVGAVALDQHGHIAAGTSTGGMTNKKWNRIGDSPVIGAGTWASDSTCGVSCTGHGEYFIRLAVAHTIHARMLYGGQTLSEAAHKTIWEDLQNLGGIGGIIAVDRDGNHEFIFNTQGMFRGHIDQNMAPKSEAFELKK